MSNKVRRVVLDGQAPLVFAEKPKAVGNGGKAFKTLTAAVRAAEAARDEVKAELAEARELAVAYREAAEELLEAAMGRLRMAERVCGERAAMVRRWVWVDLVIFGVGAGVFAAGCALGWW